MIKARHKRIYHLFFDRYIRFIVNHHFKEHVLVDKGFKPDNNSVLVTGNHISWWDGFWMHQFNKKVLHKKLHILMLEEQLRPRMFLNKIGAAGFLKNSRDVLKALSYCTELLNDPTNALFFFPEGRINPQNNGSVHFEKGILRLLEPGVSDISVLFVINLTEYFSNSKPTLYTFYKTAPSGIGTDLEALTESFNQFLYESKMELLKYCS